MNINLAGTFIILEDIDSQPCAVSIFCNSPFLDSGLVGGDCRRRPHRLHFAPFPPAVRC